MATVMLKVGDIRARARQDACDVLSQYWAGSELPVDPYVIARAMGISVIKARLQDDVLGVLVGSSGGADIYLDSNQPGTRMRFTCAHELGHFIDRKELIFAGNAFVDRRSDNNRGDAAEIYADEFAGNLLMPIEEFRDALEGEPSLIKDFTAAERFDVSVPALERRKQSLGFGETPCW